MRFRSAHTSTTTDNRIAFLDQAAFLRLRATGLETVAQCSWVYDRAVSRDALRRFNENLGRGLLGRRIERSPLSFGRHRWVAYHEPPDMHVAATPRPRTEVSTWMDERAQIPVDPEKGPCWHLGVLPLDDGGTAISLVTSHTVVDGAAVRIAVTEAIKGVTRELGYPPPGSRPRLRALLVDARDTLRGIPELIRALIASLLILLRGGHDVTSQLASPCGCASRSGSDEPIVVPSATLFLDSASWEARALNLSGTSNSLFIAFATKLAELMGRVSPTNGAVTITVPVSERIPDDTRGNALTAVTLRVDPGRAVTDLQVIRNELKQGLASLQHTHNELLGPLPLVPLTPKWLARKVEGIALGNSDFPVGCSNLGNMSMMSRIDGDDVEFSARLFNQGATRRSIENAGGQLYLFSGWVDGKIFISVSSYQPGSENSKHQLREILEKVLAEYQLTASIRV